METCNYFLVLYWEFINFLLNEILCSLSFCYARSLDAPRIMVDIGKIGNANGNLEFNLQGCRQILVLVMTWKLELSNKFSHMPSMQYIS